jgi:endonuclease G
MIESFALSNMIPQDPFNNRKGAWIKAESDTRKFARRAQGDVFVFSGPLFRGEVKKIGPNNVWVPSHIFKLVYDQSSGRSWAHIVANTAEARLEAPHHICRVRQRDRVETAWRALRDSADGLIE